MNRTVGLYKIVIEQFCGDKELLMSVCNYVYA